MNKENIGQFAVYGQLSTCGTPKIYFLEGFTEEGWICVSSGPKEKEFGDLDGLAKKIVELSKGSCMKKNIIFPNHSPVKSSQARLEEPNIIDLPSNLSESERNYFFLRLERHIRYPRD